MTSGKKSRGPAHPLNRRARHLGMMLPLCILMALFAAAPEVVALEDNLDVDIDEYLQLETILNPGQPVDAQLSNPVVELFPKLGVWNAHISGTMSSGTPPLQLDLFDDLGLESNTDGFIVYGQISLGFLAIRYSSFFAQFEGQNTLTRDIDFGGISFTISDDITSSLEINNYTLMLAVRLINIDGFKFYVEGGVSYYQLEGTVASTTFGTGTETADVPVPVIGALIQLNFGRFFVELELMGLDLEYGNTRGSVLDGQVSVGVRFLRFIAARAGYRYIDFDGKHNDFEVGVVIDGFFFSVGIVF